MSKKMLKRSLALGALMAFVITGSAMAAETTLEAGKYNVIYNSSGQLACPAIWGDVLPEHYWTYGNYIGNDEANSILNIGDGVNILSSNEADGKRAVMNVMGGASNSTVNITGGTIEGNVYGGLRGDGNTVNISGGKITYTSYTDANGDTVELGGAISITNGGSGNAGGNINISGTADLSDATLYGVKPYYSNGTVNFMDGWTGTVRAVDTNDVVNITDGADVTIGDIKSANTTINLDNATWTIADDTNVIAKLTGENGVIKVDSSLLGTTGVVQIGANESTGTVIKTGVTGIDLSGGAKKALENATPDSELQAQLANVINIGTSTAGSTVSYAIYAQDTSLHGNVDLVDGKVVTEMDTDVLVARDDVKAGNISLVDTAQGVKDNASAIATKADKATTLAGYGITDAYTKTEVDIAITGKTGNLQYTSTNYVDQSDNLTQATSKLDAQVKVNADEITGLDGRVANNTQAITAETTAREEGDRVNAEAIAAVQIATTGNTDAISGINQRLEKTNAKINKVGAGAAALAALHPLDYDPDDKLTFSAGMGNYAGENAAALGAFYRPNEKFMVSLGGTMGNGENMVNLGLSIGLDKPNGLAKLSKRELIQKVNAVEAENDALEDRVAKLEALVAQLVNK